MATTFSFRRWQGQVDHALAVADGVSLDQVYAKLLRDPDVDIEFAPETLNGGPAQHLICNIPGGIRVEFIAPTV